MRSTTILAAMALSCGAVLAADEKLAVKLTVQERLGVARVNEPVTSGVPLPGGAVKDVGQLALVDAAGKPVPAQFSAATRWWQDKSIKWVHVDFAASVPANGTARYTLRTGAEAAKANPPVKVAKTSNGIEVDTGPIRFAVNRRGFKLFDGVWLDGKPVVRPDAGGIMLSTPGGRFAPTEAGGKTVAIEQQGPRKVVLRVAGRNAPVARAGGPAPRDAYGMDYKCRIYAYAGSPLVKVVYTVENRRGKWDEHIDLDDWFISLGVNRGDGKLAYRFGLAEKPVAGTLTDGEDEARLDVTATDRYEFSGLAKGEGNPHKEAPPWIGTLDVAGPAGGVTVAVKNFRQMWSKYLAAQGNGSLVIGLWSDRVRDKGTTTLVDEAGRVQFFAGVGRTHEIWFNFHRPDAADPIAAMAPAREPLFARCDPAWYCQGTKVFGDLSEADPNVYLPQWREKVKALNRWAEASVAQPLKRWRTVKAGVNGAVDSFGMLNYGDSVEEHNDGAAPTRIHWEGGYYDYMHSILLNFARTGNLFYLWLANDMSRHNAEVHHTHHDQYPGRSRYCPSYAHIIMPGRGYYASGTFNHWKNLSIFERWYLLGDHRAREAALEVTEHAMRLGNSGISFGQPRAVCHGLLGFWAGYEATGERKYMDAMAKFARRVAGRLEKGGKMGSGAWQRGMALQGLCWYVEKTGDESVLPGIEKALTRDLDSRDPEMAYALIFMWKRTGDAKYFSRAVRYLGGSPKVWMQRFGNHGRSKLYVPTIVRTDAPRQPPASQ